MRKNPRGKNHSESNSHYMKQILQCLCYGSLPREVHYSQKKLQGEVEYLKVRYKGLSEKTHYLQERYMKITMKNITSNASPKR